MTFSTIHHLPSRVPEGYWAAALDGSNASTPLPSARLAVLVREKPDDLGGRLVMLRHTLDAKVFLGCLIDADASVIKWVEISVQDLEGVTQSAPACREALSNCVVDERWGARFRAIQARDPADVIACGWENAHPRPMFIDLEKKTLFSLGDPKTGEWRLCEDDALLKQKGLPEYSTTLARFLYSPESKEASAFVEVLPGAGAESSGDVVGFESIVDVKRTIPLNAGGGLMMVQSFSPIELEQYIGVLGGQEWSGLQHGRTPLAPPTAGGANSQLAGGGGGSVFLDRHGRWGRVVESLHLKLRLMLGAVIAVCEECARTQMPLLNVSPESFRVRVGEDGVGLPSLWNARIDLRTPGDAAALPIEGSEAHYAMRAGSPAVSIYQPDVAGQSIGGRGQVRVRQLIEDGGGRVTVEGTLTTHERVSPAMNDLFWIQLPLANQRIEMHARLSDDAGTARGEIRFRSVPHAFGEAQLKALRAATGVPVGNCTFELIPLLSSPCDLYSLAVLAVQTLLAGGDNPLPVALDAVLSLAREVALDHDPSVGPRLRVQTAVDAHPAWLEALGPQRISQEPMSVDEAFDLIPPDVWWDVLANVVAMLPGIGPDSDCRDFGDAMPGGIHKAFDPAIERLTSLVVRTRSLIVIDWRFNREIHSVIRRFEVGLAGEGVGA